MEIGAKGERKMCKFLKSVNFSKSFLSHIGNIKKLADFWGFQIFPFGPPHETMKIKVV